MTGPTATVAAPGSRFALVGGHVVDGSGAPPRSADVIVNSGVIESVVSTSVSGGRSTYDGYERVECAGKLITPGFVDIHCHSDLSLFVYPENESRVTQGVTTEVIGNCGMSAAPSGNDNVGLATVIGTINVVPEFPWLWNDVSQWLTALDATPTTTNVAAQVGHGSARFVAAGPQGRPLNSVELLAMEREIERALDEGCVGVSLGLMYAPGEGASKEELVRVAKFAAAQRATLSVHMRDYSGEGLLDSVNEVLAIAEESAARVQISHLRRTGSGGSFEDVLDRIDHARRTADVAADVYPYIAGHTNLIQLFPSELRSLGPARLTKFCREQREDAKRLLMEAGFEPVDIMIMKAPRSPEAVGLHPDELGGQPWAALVDLLVANECIVDVAVNSGHWVDVDRALATPWITIGSDGTALGHAHTSSVPHPRSWGSFPAAFRRMHALGVPTGEIIRRMTDAPARRAGLTARVERGHRADLTVIDESRFVDRATFANPSAPADGVEHVFVHGEAVLHNSNLTDRRPGRLIRRKHRG